MKCDLLDGRVVVAVVVLRLVDVLVSFMWTWPKLKSSEQGGETLIKKILP